MRYLSTIPLVLALLLISACNGGGEGDLTDREITDEELSLMVLPQSEMGSQYAEFEIDDDSGPWSNEDAIDDAFDEEDEAKDIEQFGRVKGYQESYTSVRALLQGEGMITVGTAVALYENADGAAADLSDDTEDSQRAVGKTQGGMTVEDVELFDPGPIGDGADAQGVTLSVTGQADAGGVTFYGTMLAFRRGRLIGYVVLTRWDREDMRDEAATIARELDERMLAALRGEVEPRPTATTEPPPAPRTNIAPSDVLESFRFSSEILAETDGGLVLRTEGEFQAPDRLRCAMTASLGGAMAGTSELVVIGDDAWYDEGDGFEATSADDPDVVDDLDLCPGSPLYWEDFDFISGLSELPLAGQPETVNGVATKRYSLAETADALKSIGFVSPELQGLTINLFDVWVAQDGEWPVAVNFDYSADAEATREMFGLPMDDAGDQAHIAIRAEITDVNSPDVRVEAPTP